MMAVIFEVLPKDGARDTYLEHASHLRDLLQDMPGFLSIERFQSLSEPDKLLSLSFWEDEAAVANWRNQPAHRATQSAGRHEIFQDYRLRVAEVARDYGLTRRDQAPPDSRSHHD